MSEVRLQLTVEYDLETETAETEAVVEEVMLEETRRFAANLTDNLERRGIDELQVRIRGD